MNFINYPDTANPLRQSAAARVKRLGYRFQPVCDSASPVSLPTHYRIGVVAQEFNPRALRKCDWPHSWRDEASNIRVTDQRAPRWWPAMQPSSLFAVPPFPGRKPDKWVIPQPFDARTREEVAACIEAMRHHRVGGTFWDSHPVSANSDVLVRPRDAGQYQRAAALAETRRLRATYWFPDAAAALTSGANAASVVIGPCDPWYLLTRATELWTDAEDEVGLIATIAGTPQSSLDPGSEAIDPVARLAKLLGSVRFEDPFSRAEVGPSRFVELLGFWRMLIDANRPIRRIYGVAHWKREAVAPLLWDGSMVDRFHGTIDQPDGAAAAWIARTPASVLLELAHNNTPVYQLEDGFIRSVGLGADCVPPLSIVVDAQSAHYDPARPSELEMLLQHGDFDRDLLERARALRTTIVAQGISKYAQGTQILARTSCDRRRVLITGQVEDDQSVLKGGGGIVSNLELLRRVREREPQAHITYRPHPDVDAGHRKGHIADDVVLTLADAIARDVGITALIDATDHLHVLTSLAGFEALMRGTSVTTHGVPFYAGWGLTEDLGPVPARRTTRRSLDELVAATLMQYPRYLDPITGLPCPPEILVKRIAAGVRRQNTPLVIARRLVGKMRRYVRRMPGAR
ncbi:capsule biosynthesis protein [Sphingomonas qilianensis]|uniref:Capsule biosynthesis protein n=1 Tax=Sphingomonas qilianensis TaxID=1736690 RepID=A0ABU9XRC6_9SPHN